MPKNLICLGGQNSLKREIRIHKSWAERKYGKCLTHKLSENEITAKFHRKAFIVLEVKFGDVLLQLTPPPPPPLPPKEVQIWIGP